MKMERVCFRIEHDPYMDIDVILAVFPDDEANRGRFVFLPMWFNNYGQITFGCHDEMDIMYYWNCTKPLKDDKLAKRCVEMLEAYEKTEDYELHFRIVKRIIRR